MINARQVAQQRRLARAVWPDKAVDRAVWPDKAVDRAARYAQIRAVERGKAVKGLFKTAYFDHFASPSLHNA